MTLDRRFGPAFEYRPNTATLPALGCLNDSDSAKRAAGTKNYLMVLADFMNQIHDLRLERNAERMARAAEKSAWDQGRETLQTQIFDLKRAKRLSENELEQLKQRVGSGTNKRNDKNGDMRPKKSVEPEDKGKETNHGED